MFTNEQKDALQEYMNIFNGQAASLLSELLNKKIELHITELKLFKIGEKESAQQVDNGFPALFSGNIVSSSISFGDKFSGKAQLIFPVETSKELVRLCLNEESGNEALAHGGLTDTDYDALKEVGNIILNSIIGGFGNLLSMPLQFELPEVNVLTSFNPTAALSNQEDEQFILVFLNTFSVQDTLIEGAIVVVLSINSITMLLNKIDEVLIEIDIEE